MTAYSHDAAELYPMFLLRKPGEGWDDLLVEFSDAELADLKRVALEWAEWQVRLAERFKIERSLSVRDYDVMVHVR